MATEHSEVTSPTAEAGDNGALYQGSIDTLMATNQALIGGAQAIGTEMLAFWQSRLKEGFATGNRLTECRSTQDAAEIHLEHLRAAWQAYLDHGTKVAELAVRAATDGAAARPAKPQRRVRLAIESAA